MPKNNIFIQKFGYKGPFAKDIISIFIKNIENPQIHIFYDKWLSIFQKIYGNLSEIRNVEKEIKRSYGISVKNLNYFLFSVQTYYIIIVKIIAFELLNKIKKTHQKLSNLEDLKSFLENLENGSLFQNFGIKNLPIENLFSWYISIWNNNIEYVLRDLIKNISKIDLKSQILNNTPDQLQLLYENLIPQRIRHQLGEFYTPLWLANYLIEKVGFDGNLNKNVLDPSCGSGIFLSLEIKKILNNSNNLAVKKDELFVKILKNVIGFDINPLALITSKVNYLISIYELLSSINCEIEIPIYSNDAITGPPFSIQFDYIIGNPPWINWEDLGKDYRESLIELWKKYGLFSLKGQKARMGGGRKDLSMLFTYSVVDKYLRKNGLLGFIITQTIFKTMGAGDGFRRFQIGNGVPLKVLNVIDMVDIKPFQNTSNMTSILILKKGAETTYPIPYIKVKQIKKMDNTLKKFTFTDFFEEIKLFAEPITKKSSPWFTTTKKLLNLKRIIGPSPYTAYLGLNTGGANGVYWVNILESDNDEVLIENKPEEGKKKVEKVKFKIEKNLIYPLIKSRNLRKWKLIGEMNYSIIVQDPQKRQGIKDLDKKFPKTYHYLKKFKEILENRAMLKKYFQSTNAPFYSMFNIGTYTFSPFKVVWNRMGKKLNASVLEPFETKFFGIKVVIPDNVLTFIPFHDKNEAYFVCSIINSKLCSFILHNFSLKGGKSFAPPSILKFLNIPKYDSKNNIHKNLAKLSGEAHTYAKKEQTQKLNQNIQKINDLVFKIYQLTPSEISEMHQTEFF